jgi:hypothetical protein
VGYSDLELEFLLVSEDFSFSSPASALVFGPCLQSAKISRGISKTRGVSHRGLAIYIEKYVKAKEETWKLKYFTMRKIQS